MLGFVPHPNLRLNALITFALHLVTVVFPKNKFEFIALDKWLKNYLLVCFLKRIFKYDK